MLSLMEQILNSFGFFMMSFKALCRANEHRLTKEQNYSWIKLEHTLVGFSLVCQSRVQKHNKII